MDSVGYLLRDVLTALAIFGLFCVKTNRFRNKTIGIAALVSFSVVLLALLQLMLGLMSPSVAAVGVRSYLSPLLFVVLIAVCEDPIALGRRTITIICRYAPPMAILTLLQVASPPNSFVNRELSGEAATFLNDGIVRASGTFSAPAGMIVYVLVVFVSAFIALTADGFGLSRRSVGLALASGVVMVSVGGSRGAVLMAATVLAAFLAKEVRHLRNRSFSILASLGVGIVAILLLAFYFVPQVLMSFQDRFTDASRSEDTSARILDSATSFIGSQFTVFGDGAGNHSQAGIAAGGVGPWIEVDSLRVTTELGLLGWLISIARILIPVMLLAGAFLGGPRLHARVIALAGVSSICIFGSITQTPMQQGAFSILLGLVVLVWSHSARVPDETPPDILVSTRGRIG